MWVGYVDCPWVTVGFMSVYNDIASQNHIQTSNLLCVSSTTPPPLGHHHTAPPSPNNHPPHSNSRDTRLTFVCPCRSKHPRRTIPESLINVIPIISKDKWYQSLLPHLSFRRGTPPIILPQYWKSMMESTDIIKFQQSIHHDVFEVRATPHKSVGRGLYVRNGETVRSGFIIMFWGAIAPFHNPCLESLYTSRQIPLPFHPHFPARFFIHPDCLAGFINDSAGSTFLSDRPNCRLYFDEFKAFDSNTYIPYIEITRDIAGDGTEASQLLFKYE